MKRVLHCSGGDHHAILKSRLKSFFTPLHRMQITSFDNVEEEKRALRKGDPRRKRKKHKQPYFPPPSSVSLSHQFLWG